MIKILNLRIGNIWRDYQESKMTIKGNAELGFGSILFLIFLVLKLTNYINWSWWWVTSPLWLPTAMIFVGVLAYYTGKRLFE